MNTIIQRLITALYLAAVLAWTAAGRAAPPPPGGAAPLNKYAVLIGVSQYDGTDFSNLSYTEKDMIRLKPIFTDNGYDVVLMTSVAPETRYYPTTENIRRELKLILANRSKSDMVVIAFAGHGVKFRNEPESYFCPRNARLNDKSTLISLTQLYGEMERSAAGTKILLVDACRNDPTLSAGKLESVTAPMLKTLPGGVAALFSCSEGEKAYESHQLQRGIFFHYLAAGLRGEADLIKDGRIMFGELAEFTKNKVKDQARKEWGVQQVPQDRTTLSGEVALSKASPAVGAIQQAPKPLELDPIQELTNAIKAEPNRADLYFKLAKEYEAVRDDKRAIKNYRLAWEKGLQDKSCLAAIVEFYIRTRDLNEAKDFCDRILNSGKQPIPEVYMHYARILEAAGSPAAAKAWYEHYEKFKKQYSASQK